MRALFLALLRAALAFAVLFFIFWWANFATRQTVVLALIGTAVYDAYRTEKAEKQQESAFTPFRVMVWPKFPELLLGLNAVTQEGLERRLFCLTRTRDLAYTFALYSL